MFCQTHTLTTTAADAPVKATKVDPYGRHQCDYCFDKGEAIRAALRAEDAKA